MYFLRSKKLARDLRNKYLRFRTAAFCEAKGATCFAAYYFFARPERSSRRIGGACKFLLSSFCHWVNGVLRCVSFFLVVAQFSLA